MIAADGVRTIDALLARRAATRPSAPFLRFPGSDDVTFSEADERSRRLASGLHHVGVGRGDLVALLAPNRVEFVLTWFALAQLGAAAALVNIAFRGRVLAHVLGLTEASVIVADASLCHLLCDVADDLTALRTLVVIGDCADAADAFPQWQVLAFSDVQANEPAPPASLPGNAESDRAIVLFTSGTTGRSKGCVLSHRYCVRQAELMIEHLALRDDDVLFCPFPLFHLDASVLTVMPALVLGTTAAITERFSASRFWTQIRELGATVFDFMGATLAILHKQPAAVDDLDNPARLGWGVPLPDFTPDFEARFGVVLVELYGSTDVGVPLYTPLDEPRRLGSCGRPISAYDVRLHDDHGQEVPVGETGEIVVRPNEPSLIADGYLGMPDETLRATRNLWFHTGDLARRDNDGFFTFVGRRKDAIRRRGENISAFEVEEIVDMHPDVLESAAFGVASELSEDDVMIAVVARPGRAIDPAELVAFCEARMAAYMVPRYIDIVAALPKTPTEKVEKYRLADAGVTDTSWDREA